MMNTLTDKNMVPLIPPWATAAPPYTYDATPTHCYLCTCNALCDYDDTRCANSRTSSTTVTTKFHGEAGFEDYGGLFEDASGGDEQDTADHGMSLYGYRYYNPELGRWVNRDPIGEDASRMIRYMSVRWMLRGVVTMDVMWNMYARIDYAENIYKMVWNDPLGYVDVLGLQGCSCRKDVADDWEYTDTPRRCIETFRAGNRRSFKCQHQWQKEKKCKKTGEIKWVNDGKPENQTVQYLPFTDAELYETDELGYCKAYHPCPSGDDANDK